MKTRDAIASKKAYYKTKLNVLEYSGMFWNILESEIREKLTWTWSWPELSLGDLWSWSERLWNVLECSRMLRKVLWVVGGGGGI